MAVFATTTRLCFTCGHNAIDHASGGCTHACTCPKDWSKSKDAHEFEVKQTSDMYATCWCSCGHNFVRQAVNIRTAAMWMRDHLELHDDSGDPHRIYEIPVRRLMGKITVYTWCKCGSLNAGPFLPHVAKAQIREHHKFWEG